MKYKLQSIGVLSFAKIVGCLYGCIALIFVPFILIIGAAGALAGGKNAAIGAIGMVALCVLMPFVYAIMGFLFGALFAWIYNLLAKGIGAIELRLDAVATPVMSGPVV